MSKPINFNPSDIAIEGYDPVSYFLDHPTLGNPNLTLFYEGAIEQFASEANKTILQAESAKYIP